LARGNPLDNQRRTVLEKASRPLKDLDFCPFYIDLNEVGVLDYGVQAHGTHLYCPRRVDERVVVERVRVGGGR
jgi:hypothetical protein